jgi:hypothetical protein
MALEINPELPQVHPRDVYNIDFLQSVEWAIGDWGVEGRGRE